MLLHINVVQAMHVPTTDLMSKSDPFVVIIPSFSDKKVKTQYVKDNDCPIFKEQFTFLLKNIEEDYLTFQIFDYNIGRDHSLLAQLRIYAHDFIEGEVVTHVYEMEPESGFNESPNLTLQIQMAVRGRTKFVPYGK